MKNYVTSLQNIKMLRNNGNFVVHPMMVAVETFLPKHMLRSRDDPDIMPNLDFDLQQHH